MSGAEAGHNDHCCRPRILIVENDPRWRRDHQQNLSEWGYQVFVAEGVGPELLASAKAQAWRHRCHVAIVNMRLRDNLDRNDQSGLDLASELEPTKAIIVSGHGDQRAVRRALGEKKLFDFVAKEDGPEPLRDSVKRAARDGCACRHDVNIIWSHELSAAKIATMLFPNDPEVPPDEANDLIGRLFPDARRISLELITGISQTPDSKPFAPRRRSLVFKAIIDSNRAFLLIKFAHAHKVAMEVDHFGKYVQFMLKALYRPELIAHQSLWDIGAVAYTFLETAQTFSDLYRNADRFSTIQKSLRQFFDDNTWGIWYRSEVTVLTQSLFEAYDATWGGALSQAIEQWRNDDWTHNFPGLPAPLPNPTRWLAAHYHKSSHVLSPRQAVTHGDLHGDNLFVDRQGNVWPIDFERTGPGPILRDYVELSQDILTRLTQFDEHDLVPLYELAVALAAPTSTSMGMRETRAIQQNSEVNKAFQILKTLRRIAHDQTRYTDCREYLWGLLFECLFAVSLLPAESPRRNKALLLASVICGRLDHWSAKKWPPGDWPPVTWQSTTGTRPDWPHDAPEYEERRAGLLARISELANEIDHLKKLRQSLGDRLKALQVRQAKQSYSTAAEVVTEIEEITRSVEEHDQQIQTLTTQRQNEQQNLGMLERNRQKRQ
ncbi:MAG: phosphotransferase [Roseiflexaceae bacterium]